MEKIHEPKMRVERPEDAILTCDDLEVIEGSIVYLDRGEGQRARELV